MLVMKTIEDEWYIAVRLKVYHIEFFVLSYIACLRYTYIATESADSMLPQVFVLMNFYILMKYVFIYIN